VRRTLRPSLPVERNPPAAQQPVAAKSYCGRVQPPETKHAVPCASVALQANPEMQSIAVCLFVHTSALQPVLQLASSVGVNGVVEQADALSQTVEQVLLLPQEARVRAAINPAARIRVRFAMGLPWFAHSERRASLPLSPMNGPGRRP
jgi:hypothetical protein